MTGLDSFSRRHLGSSAEVVVEMVNEIGYAGADVLVDTAVPEAIRFRGQMKLPPPLSETDAVRRLQSMMAKNRRMRSFIGAGYHGCVTPAVIRRNILENPGWYTAYTPYQAEIAQGRLEALLNYQTMIRDLTGLDVANASLLDEATAAAEGMGMAVGARPKGNVIFVSELCHPQTIDVLRTRAFPLGIEVAVGDHVTFSIEDTPGLFAVLVQYPASDGAIIDYEPFLARAREAKILSIVAADLLSLILLRPPGEFGADICVGSSQRFGVPMGYGGPHAAFIACAESLKRRLPGRLVGVSHDAEGNPAFRLALQTREQHIRRDRANSNICTAQVLLAVMAVSYAIYHGPEGLKEIAFRISCQADTLAEALQSVEGLDVDPRPRFDTVRLTLDSGRAADVAAAAREAGMNLRLIDASSLGITFDETTRNEDLAAIIALFGGNAEKLLPVAEAIALSRELPSFAQRTSPFLTHAVFNSYHTETAMLRYLHDLESRDLALNVSMIPLGSCTMKLNATSEMVALGWESVTDLHPFVPADQAEGYAGMIRELESWLAEITGFAGVSLQPNAGSQGEYAGLLAIRRFHEDHHGNAERTVCLIPVSAHGTNPASAVMAGFKVAPVQCDAAGNIDIGDLRAKCELHKETLAALMVTYPSTHGVFEERIRDICDTVHTHGGQVYLDGANMNALVGLCRPADFGADVCHLNLHKTFCIPHGGGGPGVGPIAVAEHLVRFLPGHREFGPERESGGVCAAPFGSASILSISWIYIAMMGADGLTEATRQAIVNANYMAHRLGPYFPVLYRGNRGLVAHECIIDLRPCKEKTGIDVEDVAKRLMDYGFHAPTMSWPVPGTLMIEPTECESREELDRFCDAMIRIHGEIQALARGEADRQNNLLKGAPHTAAVVCADSWDRPYSREAAAFPAPWNRRRKFWPAVSRIDNVYGDRNLVCTCDSVEAYADPINS